MSQEETLRLAAEIQDKMSGPLKAIQQQLTRLSDATRKGNKEGEHGAKVHREQINQLGDAFRKVEDRVKSGFVPALTAVGVTTLSVGAALESLKSTVFGFGETGRALSMLSRETGFSVQKLRELEAVGRRLNIAPEALRQSTRQFAQHMHDFRRMSADEINKWLGHSDVATQQFVRSISKMPIEQAYSRAVGFMRTIHDPQDKTKYARMLGIPENFADVPTDRLRQMFSEVRKSIGVWGPEQQKKAEAFEDAMDRLNDSVENLKVKIGSGLGPAFTQITDAITKFVDVNQDSLVKSLQEVATWIQNADWKGFAAGVDSTATSVGKLVTELGGLQQTLKTIASMWLGRMLLGGPGMIGGALWNAPHPKSLDMTPSEALRHPREFFLGLNNNTYLRHFTHHRGKGATPGVLARPGSSSSDDLGLDSFGMPGGSLDWARKNLIHKESFQSAGGFRLLSGTFTGGGATRGAEEAISRAVKSGTLEAFREWAGLSDADNIGAGGSASIRQASFGGGGEGGAGPGAGGLGGIGGLGGGGTRHGRGRSAGLEQGGAETGAPAGSGIAAPGASNAYISAARSRFAAELSDPNKRLQFGAMLLSEGSPQPTAESAMNRSLYSHRTLMQMLHSGFYGPINRGQLPAFERRLQRDPRLMARMNAAIDRALGGSDMIHGATDQGMPSDPNGRWPGGRMRIGGNVFNDWGGGPGGHAGAARWRQQFEERAAQAARMARSNIYLHHFMHHGAQRAPDAALHGHYTTGDVWNALNGVGNDSDLLRAARKSGMLAPAAHRLEGGASLHVAFDGLPRGSRVKAERQGNAFDTLTIERGKPMVRASTDR